MKQGRSTYLFPGGNTGAGFVAFYRELLASADKVFILKGGPGCGKSTLMQQLGHQMLERGYDVEFWRCGSDDDSLDGIWIPVLRAAVIDGTPPHTIDPRYPGAIEELVDLGLFWDASKLRSHKREIVSLGRELDENYAQVQEHLHKAAADLLSVRRKNEATLDAEKLASHATALTEAVFRPAPPRRRRYFSGAVLPNGYTDLTEPLMRRAERRIWLTGPIGCGKELLLASLAAAADARGYFAELALHPLLPETLRFIYLPELDTAIAAVEMPPEALVAGDTVIPCSTQSQEDMEIQKQAAEQMAEAAAVLHSAKERHDRLEAFYKRAIDFSSVDQTGERILGQLLQLADQTENA